MIVMNLTLLLILLFGWAIAVLINHIASVLPHRESIRQKPFCTRRLNFDGTETISTAIRGEENTSAPEICHVERPLLAWSGLLALLTGNRICPGCGKPLGARHTIVEIIFPILLVILYRQFGVTIYFGWTALFSAILTILFITDLEHRLIQHKIIFPAILLALAGGFFSPIFNWKLALLGGAVGFVSFYILALLARGGLGEGDITLSAFLGLIIGFPNIVLALLYGILLGGAVSVILLITRRATMKTFIPYGPFLILAGWAVMVWNQPLMAAIFGN